MDNRQSTQPRHPKQRLVTAGIALMACLVPVGQIFSEGWSNPLIGTHLVQGLAWALVLIGMAIAAEKYHQLRGHDLLVCCKCCGVIWAQSRLPVSLRKRCVRFF